MFFSMAAAKGVLFSRLRQLIQLVADRAAQAIPPGKIVGPLRAALDSTAF